MKSAVVLCVLVVAGMTLARPEEKYTDRYDSVDLDEVLGNDKILDAYVNCILDKGRCAPDAKELKEHIREALENECAKCTKAQRNGTRRVIGHLINKKPTYWDLLTAKYDADKKFVGKYEKELREVTA